MKTIVFLCVFISLALSGDSERQSETVTCEQALSYRESTRGWIILSTMIGYASGWADAIAERDGAYPEWIFQHRYGTFADELEIICEHRPKWSIETAAATAFADIRLGRPWSRD